MSEPKWLSSTRFLIGVKHARFGALDYPQHAFAGGTFIRSNFVPPGGRFASDEYAWLVARGATWPFEISIVVHAEPKIAGSGKDWPARNIPSGHRAEYQADLSPGASIVISTRACKRFGTRHSASEQCASCVLVTTRPWATHEALCSVFLLQCCHTTAGFGGV